MDIPVSIRRAKPLLGTFVEITANGGSRCDPEKAIDSAFEAIADVHRLMSFHEQESDVSRLNRDAWRQSIPVSPWTFRVLESATEMNCRSGGLFDIAVGRALQRKGLLCGTSPLATFRSRLTDELIKLLPNHRVRFLDSNVSIDLGGIAKGFAVDRAVDALRNNGIDSGVVNAGGDLTAFGDTPHTIYIRHPRCPEQLLFCMEITNQSLASTGGQFDPLYASKPTDTTVIDPVTQEPAHRICGATVRAPSCMIADALTKLVMIEIEQSSELLQRYCASALAVLRSGDVWLTSDWQNTVGSAA